MKNKISGIFEPNVTFRNGQMAVLEEDGVTIKEMIATSDTKQFFTQSVNTFFMQENPDDDRQWEQIFRVIPGQGHGELLPFRPPDATTTVSGSDVTGAGSASVGSHGIVFTEVGELGEIKFSRVTSAEKYVRHVKYGTAIGYSNEWFSDGSMALIQMVTEDFRQASADKMAAIHYGAIVAAVNAGISATAALSSTGTSNVAKIINSLTDACVTMRRAKRRPTIVLAPPECEQPLRLALKMTQGGGTPDIVQTEMVSRLQPIITEYIASGTVYVIEPFKRLVSTNRLPLSLGNFSDLLHDAEVLVGKFRRGVLVGEGAVIRAITSFPTAVVSAYDFA